MVSFHDSTNSASKETRMCIIASLNALLNLTRSEIFGWAILLLGAIALCFSAALCVRTYMPCPFGDDWFVVTNIAQGNGPLSFAWLWAQHNEHRIPITRLLIWLDLFVFGGTNKSLFVEIFFMQLLHWAAISCVIERWTAFEPPIRRTLQGLFAFCLFHPNQYENFTWAFQISFILPFTIITVALLAITFYERLRCRAVAGVFVAMAPLLAALNMAGGLVAGPVLPFLAVAKHLRIRLLALIALVFTLSCVAYVWQYHPPHPSHGPGMALRDPLGILKYVLTYFGASWTRLLPHKERIIAFVSLVACVVFAVRAFRGRKSVSNFEWFCLGECTFSFGVAVVTGLGRLYLGPGQAFASRYQTAAMIFWAALCSLILLAVIRRWPSRIFTIQVVLAAMLLLSTFTWREIWNSAVSRSGGLRVACAAVMDGTAGSSEVRTLDIGKAGLEPAETFLRKRWAKDVSSR